MTKTNQDTFATIDVQALHIATGGRRGPVDRIIGDKADKVIDRHMPLWRLANPGRDR